MKHSLRMDKKNTASLLTDINSGYTFRLQLAIMKQIPDICLILYQYLYTYPP